MRMWLTIGALSGLISVALGAFAAHGLQNRVGPTELAAFETGARYQMYHALALIAVAWASTQAGGGFSSLSVSIAGWAFLIGSVLFSGSLYYLGITGSRSLVLVTPVGGVAFLAGWVALALAGWAMKAP
ncbi:protein of unknown function DUF423 [Parvibaculum lavamentivorans DS-1]|uniref:DUF423 domain-containing protein n=1 Tax=Parvibaculum lavamentivorans (strain DS-1 / DSM 13023 / NCIMB 13966) TaxID=402881 RepID=A7HW25_PARL1|nr:DUF423 domain-containing protein [Parvibaculum lavamentivorans]ABS64108.1 protein of unknown function DUF423 [Parvibaculum lavamentivorans DS-1]